MPNRNPLSLYLQVFLGCILLFVLYGLLNTQLTMRLSPDYFARFYPDIFDASHVTESAIVWGLRAMWWVGALVGWLQVMILRWMAANEFPPHGVRRLVQISSPLAGLTVCFCVITALISYGLAALHIIPVSYWFPDVPSEMEARFLAVVVWQGALYICCLLYGVMLSDMTFGMSNRGRRWL